jgi:hypothetical protein
MGSAVIEYNHSGGFYPRMQKIPNFFSIVAFGIAIYTEYFQRFLRAYFLMESCHGGL